MDLEKRLEREKVALSLKTDFNLIDAFRLFDPEGVGQATSLQIREGLNDLGLHVGADELQLFMKRFDKDQDGRLRYSEFCDAFLPVDSFHASLLAKKAPLTMYPITSIPKNQVFYPETSQLFLQAWTVHLQNELEAAKLRF